MENLSRVSTEILISELNGRGYNTDLLISKWDVLMVLQEENEDRHDEEQIKLDNETIQHIVTNIDTSSWQREINENITNTIEDNYNNEDYYTTIDDNFIGNATYVSVWDNGERIETPCKYDSFTNEVTEVKVVEVGHDFDVCEEEYIEYDGQVIKDFKMNGSEYVEGQRFV